MNIIIVADHAYVTGGQSKVAIESALGLAARGHRVTYFAAVGPVDQRLTDSPVKVVCLGQGDINTSPAVVFAFQTLWNWKAGRELAKLIAASDPAQTVVHVHAWAKAVSPAIGPVLAAARCASVYTMHEFFMVCPNGGFYDYQRAEVCTRKPMSLDCLSTNCDSRTPLHKALRVVRQVLVNVGGLVGAFPHIITISQLQDDALRPYMPKGLIWHRVSNPIDVHDEGSKTAPGGDFLFVGRISPEKGVAHFCEAAKRAGITATIAGDGPLLDTLKAQYPDARFLGWKSPDEIRMLLRAARALVFPSVWYEGQPLTIYEALAAGTPAIVSDVCAGREAIENGMNGLLFKSADVDDLAAALRTLSDDETAARMSAAAYAGYWASPLTLDRHVDAIEGVYRAAMADASLRVATPVAVGAARVAGRG